MARELRVCTVLLGILVIAARARAAGTGMLYVKSDPPGAAVVIEGVERGKTPMLVRDLPPGEVTVMLTLPGIAPVLQTAVVEANRVANLSIEIEVASAALTVISDPLEAQVVLDTRPVGETPITLEHLSHGRHHVILLKDGFPRTVRSVHLKPGETRILEVKLGTGGEPEPDGEEDGDEGPAPVGEAATGPPPAKVPTEVLLVLKMMKTAVDTGDFAGTRTNMQAAMGQPDMAGFGNELRAAIDVMRALETRQDLMRRAAGDLVGTETELRTKTGIRKGKVVLVSARGITISSKVVINRRVVGEREHVVAWESLTAEERDRFASGWNPPNASGEVARAVLALNRGDGKTAERALASAGDHLLAVHLRARMAAAPLEAAEEAARKAWDGIAKRARTTRISPAEGKDLLRLISEFEGRHARSASARQLGDDVRETRSHVLRAMARSVGVPPDAAEHGGRFYKLYRQKVSWTMANGICKRARGHLVTITSSDENQFVINMCRGQTNKAWIGFTDSYREGRWQWVTGEKVGFTAWAPGEPNDSEGQDCGTLIISRPDGSYGGKWDDGSLQARLFFVCEWDVAAASE